GCESCLPSYTVFLSSSGPFLWPRLTHQVARKSEVTSLQSEYPNYRHNQVQGRNDLVNFFPVVLCLSNTLQLLLPSSGYEYHLYQADSARIGGAVKFVYTSLTPA